MVYIDNLYESVEEMRNIYPFKNEDAVINLEANVRACANNILVITTIDKTTGVKITMEKEIKLEDRVCQKR